MFVTSSLGQCYVVRYQFCLGVLTAGEFAMTPEERVDQLRRIYENGGAEAVDEFSKTNPAEYVQALVAICDTENDDESSAELRDSMWEMARSVIIKQLAQYGLTKSDEWIRIVREVADDESADRFEEFLRRLRN